MDLETFRAAAGDMWQEIPAAFREGVEALVVEEQAEPHPELPGIWTLGECFTDHWPSAYAGEGDVRSRVVLYHGSFERVSRGDPAFDWRAELWETLLHEVLHHREFAAAEDGLEDYDRAMDENFRRHAGQPFDPGFYRLLPADQGGAFRLESETFVETEVDPEETEARFVWRGRKYDLSVPPTGDIMYVNPVNLAQGRLWVVVWPRRPFWKKLFSITGESPRVRHLERRALPAPGAGV